MFEYLNRRFFVGVLRVFRFLIACGVGLCGSFMGLIGTQAMSRNESFLQIFIGIGLSHAIGWAAGGLFMAVGLRPPVSRLTVIGGFVAGGVIGALIVSVSAVTGWGWSGDVALSIDLVFAPLFAGVVTLWALHVARTRNKSNTNDSAQKTTG